MRTETKHLPVVAWKLNAEVGWTSFRTDEPTHYMVASAAASGEAWITLTPHAEAQALVDRLTAERDAALEDAKRLREELQFAVDLRTPGRMDGPMHHHEARWLIRAEAALKGQP